MGRTPFEAYSLFIEPLNDALQCVTNHRLIIQSPFTLRLNTEYSAPLADFDLVPLRGNLDVKLRAGHVLRIVESETSEKRTRYTAKTIEYYYEYRIAEQEILAFHWKPESRVPEVVSYPHLHVGRALLAGQQVIRPGDFHKVIIPTGSVSLESVLRLAITEFGVRPLRANWEEIFERVERATQSTIPG